MFSPTGTGYDARMADYMGADMDTEYGRAYYMGRVTGQDDVLAQLEEMGLDELKMELIRRVKEQLAFDRIAEDLGNDT